MQDEATPLSHRILFLNTLAFTVCFAAWMLNGVLVTFLGGLFLVVALLHVALEGIVFADLDQIHDLTTLDPARGAVNRATAQSRRRRSLARVALIRA